MLQLDDKLDGGGAPRSGRGDVIQLVERVEIEGHVSILPLPLLRLLHQMNKHLLLAELGSKGHGGQQFFVKQVGGVAVTLEVPEGLEPIVHVGEGVPNEKVEDGVPKGVREGWVGAGGQEDGNHLGLVQTRREGQGDLPEVARVRRAEVRPDSLAVHKLGAQGDQTLDHLNVIMRDGHVQHGFPLVEILLVHVSREGGVVAEDPVRQPPLLRRVPEEAPVEGSLPNIAAGMKTLRVLPHARLHVTQGPLGDGIPDGVLVPGLPGADVLINPPAV